MRFLLSHCNVTLMKIKYFSFIIVLGVFAVVLLPNAFATPTVEIVMEKSTFQYCEKLFYSINVSEVTGDSAIVHIRDQAGKGSSAIPIQIDNLKNPIPSVVPFTSEIFPVGKYFIEVEYSGANATAEFDLIDSEKPCIPMVMKQIAYEWLDDKISDGFLIDSINKYVDKQDIKIPDKINEKKLEDIHIPKWIKNTTGWWLGDKISDDEYSKAIQYLIDKEIIVI